MKHDDYGMTFSEWFIHLKPTTDDNGKYNNKAEITVLNELKLLSKTIWTMMFK